MWLRSAAAIAAPPDFAGLDTAVEEIRARHGVPGVAVVVTDAHAVVAEVYRGVADVTEQRPVDADTRFRMGSIAKSFVALATLRLVEEGKLELETPIATLAPKVVFTNEWEASDPVRLVHLIEHTAGFDDIAPRDYLVSNQSPTTQDALDTTRAARVARWRPGTHPSYTNTGPLVAAHIVGLIAEQPYEDYVTAQIIEPLGLSSAGYDPHPQLATGYLPDGQTVVPYSHLVIRSVGSLVATPRDLSKLVRMLLRRGTLDQGRLLKAESIERMERPQSSLAARNGIEVGYGLANATTPGFGYSFHGHRGIIDGYAAAYDYLPEHGIGYVVAINVGDTEPLNELRYAVMARIAQAHEAPIPATAEVPVDARSELAGHYEPITPRLEKTRFLDRVTDVHRVSVYGDGLLLDPWLGGRSRLAPADPTHYYGPQDPTPSISFVEHEGEQLMILSAAQGMTWRRISSLRAYGRMGAIVLWMIILLGNLIHAPFWIREVVTDRTHRWPMIRCLAPGLLATLTVITTYLLMRGIYADVLPRLGQPGPWSIGLLITLSLFPVFAVVGLLLSWRTDPIHTGPITRRMYILSGMTHSYWALWLALHGVIGQLPWA